MKVKGNFVIYEQLFATVFVQSYKDEKNFFNNQRFSVAKAPFPYPLERDLYAAHLTVSNHMLSHEYEVEHINAVVIVEVAVLPLHERVASEQILLHEDDIVYLEGTVSVNVAEDLLRSDFLLLSAIFAQ